MTKTIRLTMAQALTRFLIRQMTEIDGREVPLFAGVWAIFGHGNVAGMGEALYHVRDELPTYRAHNEQGMALAAVAYAKAAGRRRMMAATTSIGPGATNMITAAAVAHVNRLPLLLLPGDVFAHRRPDPVLQQIEDFGDGTMTVNDCFRPVSRYFDRITRAEQIIPALQRTMAVLTDPADCGPVTLSLCQDVQGDAFDYPVALFEKRVWRQRRTEPDRNELADATAALKGAKQPLIIAGGGVLYSGASAALATFAEKHGLPVCETQAGKSSLPHDHPLNLGSIGVTGSSAANALAEKADVILAVGTRLADFTTGSWTLFRAPSRTVIGLNAQAFDAGKRGALPLVADARQGLAALSGALGAYKAPVAHTDKAKSLKADWDKAVDAVIAAPKRTNELPSDMQVIGAVQRAVGSGVTVVGAAGGLPGELHKLWRTNKPGGYHLEYGYSTMGYEIAGAIGVKMARPDDDVVVMIGDGSYLMANSELATSIMLGQKLTVVVNDNHGFGCINRLQRATGGESFNNLLADTHHIEMPQVDFAAHAASLGCEAVHVTSIAELEQAVVKAKASLKTSVVVIDTDPMATTKAGGAWWDVGIPEVSQREAVVAARKAHDEASKAQWLG